eukprot:gene3359-biopygen2116
MRGPLRLLKTQWSHGFSLFLFLAVCIAILSVVTKDLGSETVSYRLRSKFCAAKFTMNYIPPADYLDPTFLEREKRLNVDTDLPPHTLT